MEKQSIKFNPMRKRYIMTQHINCNKPQQPFYPLVSSILLSPSILSPLLRPLLIESHLDPGRLVQRRIIPSPLHPSLILPFPFPCLPLHGSLQKRKKPSWPQLKVAYSGLASVLSQWLSGPRHPPVRADRSPHSTYK